MKNRRQRTAIAFAGLVAAGIAVSAAPAPPVAKSAADIVASAPASAWLRVPADDLLIMDLAGGGRVVIALDPAFAPAHVANIRALVRARRFDASAIVRVQDNYVVQWGDGDRPVPDGVTAVPPAEYERPAAGLAFRPLGYRDAYAEEAGYVAGWPAAREGGRAWLVHCYAMVGVGRGMPPDTGSGAELYAVIGHAPRHLDRNITLVGRVVAGIEQLAARPRGTEALGFYKTPAERGRIVRTRLASDLPAGTAPGVELMDTASRTFARWLAARANRTEDFFVRPAGAVDLCNAMPPARIVPSEH